MKKILALVLFVSTLYLLIWLLPVSFKFAGFLFILDNTDFGIPWWLDILIDSIAGGIAFIGIKSICGFVHIRNRELKDMVGNVISIVVGFIIALLVHIFMRYWIVIVSIIGAIIVGFIVYLIVYKIKYRKKQNKEAKAVEIKQFDENRENERQ